MSSRLLPIQNISGIETIEDVKKVLAQLSTFLLSERTTLTNTETATTELANSKSDTGHTHDDRYYTESEVDTLLNGKLPTSLNLFPVYAECSTALNATSFEWSFGDGANTPTNFGIVLPDCELVYISAKIGGTTPDATIEVEKNGTLTGAQVVITGANSGIDDVTSSAVSFAAGDVLNFYTVSQTSTAGPCTVCAWLRAV